MTTPQENRGPKKPRLVFTDIQRRTLHAIFKETKRPSKEMQATIAQQLGLEVTTVANFFMNARRRSVDKWRDDNGNDNRESAPTGMPKSWNHVIWPIKQLNVVVFSRKLTTGIHVTPCVCSWKIFYKLVTDTWRAADVMILIKLNTLNCCMEIRVVKVKFVFRGIFTYRVL